MTKILACGTGFDTVGIEEICLERGVDIVAFVEKDGAKDIANNKGTSRLYKTMKLMLDACNLPGDLICRKIGRTCGIAGLVAQQTPTTYLFPERLKGKRVISPSAVPNESFDYIVIAHPSYESLRRSFASMGVSRKSILSLSVGRGRCLRKLGPQRFVLVPQNIGSGELPQRAYKSFPLKGKAIGQVPLNMSEETHLLLVAKLIDACDLAIRKSADVPDCYKAGFNWYHYLRATRGSFLESVQQRRVEELGELLRNCLRNHLTEGIFGGDAEFQSHRLTSEKSLWRDLKPYFKVWLHSLGHEADVEALGMPPVGNPYGLRIGDGIVHANSFMNQYRSTLACRLTRTIKRPVFGEIGGGLGLFAYYLLTQRQEAVYIDFDLPQNLFVASYYLSMAFPDKRIMYFDGKDDDITEDVLGRYDIILMPNYMLPNLSDASVDFFINTISFSEMDFETISEYLKQIARICKGYFYQENLADFNFSYKNFPVDLLPKPDGFRELITVPSRWPCFSLTSPAHTYVEQLYQHQGMGASGLDRV